MAVSAGLFWYVTLMPAQSQGLGFGPGHVHDGTTTIGHRHRHHQQPPVHNQPPGHHPPPGSGTPSQAQIFTCGNGVIGLLNACGSMYSSMLVMESGDAAGVILPNVQPFTFNASNGNPAFTFETLDVFCPANFGVVFQGTQNGKPTSVGICVCDASSQRTGCSQISTRYTFDAQQFPQLNGLTVNTVTFVLYGGGDGDSASAYKFRFNGNDLVSGFNTNAIQCPTLPPNPCGGQN